MTPPAQPGTALEPATPSNVDHTLRDRLLAAVERLEGLAEEIIVKLDELGVDADLEPVLGSLEVVGGRLSLHNLNQEDWATGDCDEREPDPDAELNLGGLGDAHQQTHWAEAGSPSDLEDEHDGREPQCEDEGAACEDEGAAKDEDEPWLGSREGGHGGTSWGQGTVVHGAVLDGEEYLSAERDSQGGRMVSDDGTGVYWRPGPGGEVYSLFGVNDYE